MNSCATFWAGLRFENDLEWDRCRRMLLWGEGVESKTVSGIELKRLTNDGHTFGFGVVIASFDKGQTVDLAALNRVASEQKYFVQKYLSGNGLMFDAAIHVNVG